MLIAGLDLAGVETRPSGFCILRNLMAETLLLYSDEQIITKIRDLKPAIIAVDAPLSLPAGRKSLEERSSVHLRECDRELLKKRIKFFPVTLGPMRKLTARGIKLREIFERKAFKVIEVYPSGAQDILGIPRKSKGIDQLREGLTRLGIEGLNERMTHHELDAVTSALVGKLYNEGKGETLGGVDGEIIMPTNSSILRDP
jgi:predicted nuclease with RNAse H fold